MVRLLRDNELARWDEFVAAHPLGSVYHTSTWRQVIRRTYGYTPIYALRESGGMIVAALPLFLLRSPLTGTRLVSVPGAQSCDPLVRHQDDLDTLVKWVNSALTSYRAKSIELRTTQGFAYHALAQGRALHGYSCYRLELGRDFDAIERGFHRHSIRQPLKKARAAGITIDVGSSKADVRSFYMLYLALRRRLGLLPQPFKLFENMWELMGPAGQIEILHARYRGRVVSSALLLKYGRTVTYELGASLPEILPLGVSPFLIQAAIRRANTEGYTVFDFGRTEDSNHGLTDFKRRWGAVRHPLTYHFMPELSDAASLRLGRTARALMGVAVRRSPPKVSEVLAHVFYQHFA